jgi:hypothetical protein
MTVWNVEIVPFSLVFLVYLVYLVWLVSLVCPVDLVDQVDSLENPLTLWYDFVIQVRR